jgi:hypothetical protein
MPIIAVIVIVLGVAHTLIHQGLARTPAWLVVGSILLLEPINSRFRRLPEGTPPEDAASLYARWSWLHLSRTGVAVISLIVFVLAALS